MNRNLLSLIFIVLLLIMSSCAKNTKNTTTHVMPSTEEERREECARIRQEMARVQSKIDFADAMKSGYVSAALKKSPRRELAALKSRASEVGCISAFSDSPNVKEMSFDECFKKCKDYTERSDEECFDNCNK